MIEVRPARVADLVDLSVRTIYSYNDLAACLFLVRGELARRSEDVVGIHGKLPSEELAKMEMDIVRFAAEASMQTGINLHVAAGSITECWLAFEPKKISWRSRCATSWLTLRRWARQHSPLLWLSERWRLMWMDRRQARR